MLRPSVYWFSAIFVNIRLILLFCGAHHQNQTGLFFTEALETLLLFVSVSVGAVFVRALIGLIKEFRATR